MAYQVDSEFTSFAGAGDVGFSGVSTAETIAEEITAIKKKSNRNELDIRT
jgi:hypothetical protein